MNRTITLTIFFALFAFAVFLVHYYIWKRLIKAPDIKYKKFLTILLIFLAISFPISFGLSKIIPYSISFYLLWFSTLWLGIMLLYLFTFLFIDFLHLIIYLFNKFIKNSNDFNPQRREFISKSIALGATSVVLGATILSVKKYYDIAIVKKISLKIKNLPNSFKNFKIVQISDIHIGQIMRKDTLEEIVEQVNSLNPDLIAITGDLADGSVGFLFDEVTPLNKLKAKKGVFFVTGNHEYYSGVKQWVNAIKKLGITVLENRNIEIKSNNNERISLIGVNDHDAGRFGKENAPDFKKAFKNIDNDTVKVLLTHQPIDVDKASKYNADLMLSGHTHGGQIWPFGYIVELQQKYLKGYYKYNDTHLYVNQGTGCWGPPMRLGTENEITEITLI